MLTIKQKQILDLKKKKLSREVIEIKKSGWSYKSSRSLSFLLLFGGCKINKQKSETFPRIGRCQMNEIQKPFHPVEKTNPLKGKTGNSSIPLGFQNVITRR